MSITNGSAVPATRDKARTQKAILDAARTLFFEQGAGVSLAEIAQAAGVSKGALTHHFPTRAALELAMVEQITVLFREEVYRHVDLAENDAGKLARGYIRALTSDSVVMRQTFSPTSFFSVIGVDHLPSALNITDAQHWREAFEKDGLDLALSLAVRFAAEGLAASIDTPYLTVEELNLARARLLALATPITQ